MEAGVLEVVALTGGGDGAHVADVLHHSGQGQGHDGHCRGQEHASVQIGAAEQAEEGVLKLEGQADPGGVGQGLELSRVHGVHAGDLADDGHGVGAHHAQQDGDDLHHALAPYIAAHHNGDGDEGNGPVVSAVGDSGGGEGQADADDHGTGDDGREVAHDLLGAEHLKEGGQNHVHQTGQRHAEAGVGEHLVVGGTVLQHGGDGLIAADEGEGGAQESRYLALGDKVEQQGAQACE